MINEDYPVTFGVELELVFAFRQSLLQNYLNKTNDSSYIVKNIPENDRLKMAEHLAFNYRDRQRYMGWGLTGKATNGFVITWNAKHKYRTYGDEPLQIARRVLACTCNVDVHNDEGERTDFSRWHLINDPSLVGADKSTLLTHLSDRISSVEHWDSHGLELVSRILTPTPASFTEISTLIRALNGGAASNHGALVTQNCGLHVHVGLPPDFETPKDPHLTFDIATLQHLAYILVMYEFCISTLHPAHRREGSKAAKVDIASNLTDFFRDFTECVPKDVWNAERAVWEQTDELVVVKPLREVREMIWEEGMDIPTLAKLMGRQRGHIVNWSYLCRLPGEGPRTLEFRQHEGCLDAERVKWWALFVMGLVRLANVMAHRSPQGPGNDYKWDEWSDDMSVWELFEAMQFPAEGTDYFRRRAAFLAGIQEMEGVLLTDLLPYTTTSDLTMLTPLDTIMRGSSAPSGGTVREGSRSPPSDRRTRGEGGFSPSDITMTSQESLSPFSDISMTG
ncbi:hypothetical protein MMC08_004695 [Hypocenomyce scalaris]|nr:hypothetical protein [Hypocenomyce scalaris]